MRQPLGQHFLKDKRKISQIIDALELQEGDTVIEIGPGRGALTRELGARNKALKVIAIEKDKELAAYAEQYLAPELEKAGNKFEVIAGDVREIIPKLGSYNLKSYKLVGNIPYYLTGALLRALGGLGPLPERIVLTIQKEVAERVTAVPPKMNILAASVQFWAEPKITARISAGAFSPPPDVNSAVLLLTPRSDTPTHLKERYYRLMRALFRYPRKTIHNNIAASPEHISEERLREVGIDPGARPQNLSRDDLVRLSENYENV